jgi:hypothetical protein
VLARLVKEVYERPESSLMVDYLVQLLLMDLDDRCRAAVLWSLYELDLVPIDRITQAIFSRLLNQRRSDSTVRWGVSRLQPPADPSAFLEIDLWPLLPLWFLPELENQYPYLVVGSLRSPQATPIQHHYGYNRLREWSLPSAQARELRANNWEQYLQIRMSRQNPHPLAVALAKDNVEQFQEHFSRLGFDLRFEIPGNMFDNQESMSLLSYAADHVALNCIKFLFMNGATAHISCQPTH